MRIHILLVLALFAMLSCTDLPTETGRGVDRSHPSVQLIAYSTVRISDNGAVTRSINDVETVGLGTVNGLDYIEQLRFTPSINKSGVNYFIHFDSLVTISEYDLLATVRLRLYLSSGSTIDSDTVIEAYKYPYETAEIILRPIDLVRSHAQDIAFANGLLYLLHVGSSELYVRPQGQTSLQLAMFMSESDFLAGDSCYVFIDNGFYLDRFNATLDTLDLRLRQVHPENYLKALAAENGRVYAIYQNSYIVVLDREGAIIDSIAAPDLGFHAAVNDKIIYGNYYSTNTIRRFDTKTMTSLPALKSPADNIEGMECYLGFLYYGDYNRQAVLRVPLSDLLPN